MERRTCNREEKQVQVPTFDHGNVKLQTALSTLRNQRGSSCGKLGFVFWKRDVKPLVYAYTENKICQQRHNWNKSSWFNSYVIETNTLYIALITRVYNRHTYWYSGIFFQCGIKKMPCKIFMYIRMGRNLLWNHFPIITWNAWYQTI